MKYLIILAIIAGIVGGFMVQTQAPTGAIPTTVSSSTNINQLYGEVNNLIEITTSSTRPLGVIAALSSSTGNLIVGSSSSWIARTVGANNLYLMASSTAQGGVSWESVILPGAITFNTATGTSNTSTISSFSAAFQSLTVSTATIQTAIIQVVASSTSGINYGLFSTDTLNVTSTANFIGIASFGPLTFTNATGTGNLLVNSLNITNGNEYRRKSANITIINPSATVHSTGTITIYFPVAATINSIACYSRPSGSSTISMDLRVSSTPATAGTSILALFECQSTRAVTTTIASASITADSLLNIKVHGVSNNPSSTVISIDITNSD